MLVLIDVRFSMSLERVRMGEWAKVRSASWSRAQLGNGLVGKEKKKRGGGLSWVGIPRPPLAAAAQRPGKKGRYPSAETAALFYEACANSSVCVCIR